MSQNVNIDPSGNLSVSNPEYFDFEQRYQIVGSAEVIASDDNSNETRASFQITIDITDVYDAPDPSSMSVQQRLDGTETPFDIYTSDNSLLDSLYGKTYNGGLIFYLNTTTGNGMVAYTSSFSPLAWDFNTTGLVATNANSTDVGQGETNTTSIVIVLGTGGNYPARTCRELAQNGGNGWFLPTLDELSLVYQNLHARGYGNFQNEKYWTSSELDAGNAWMRDFAVSSGQTATTVSKIDEHLFRPVRKF